MTGDDNGPGKDQISATSDQHKNSVSSDSERKLILSERSYDPAQRANDKQTPLLPLVCDIIKTPAVWSDEQIDQLSMKQMFALVSQKYKN